MTNRISETTTTRQLMQNIRQQREQLDRVSQEISTGIKVQFPGDSTTTGTISQFRQQLDRLEGYKTRTVSAESYLAYQDDAIKDAQDVLVRGKEIAQQAQNASNSPTIRAQMAEEVWQLRDHLVSLANSTYQGKYIWSGTSDSTAPYTTSTYTNPASGAASQRTVYNAGSAPGMDDQKTAQISDDLSIVLNTPGSELFNDAIEGLERLGRALSGYTTTPASGTTDGGGVAYTFPTDFETQTAAIGDAMDTLETARASLQAERTDLGGRLHRVETAKSLQELNIGTVKKALDGLQSADVTESASQLTQVQNALQASMIVSSRVMNLTILDYL